MLRLNSIPYAVQTGQAASPDLQDLVVDLSHIGMSDIAIAGGKNASLGELIHDLGQLKIAVPEGFATTAAASGRTDHRAFEELRSNPGFSTRGPTRPVEGRGVISICCHLDSCRLRWIRTNDAA